MKPGLLQIHVNSLLEFMEKRQLHPIEALQIMSVSSISILASYIEHDLTSEEKTNLGMEIEQFSVRLRELLRTDDTDLFAVLLSTQMLNRELVESAIESIEQTAKEVTKSESN